MFGITEVTSRHCIAQGCKKSATHVIGNIKYKYNLKKPICMWWTFRSFIRSIKKSIYRR